MESYYESVEIYGLELEDLRQMAAEIITEEDEKRIFLQPEGGQCQVHDFFAICRKCGWPGKNKVRTLSADNALQAELTAGLHHDIDWAEKFPALPPCEGIPALFLFA